MGGDRAATFLRCPDGKAIEVRIGAGQSPHYQVRIVDDTTDYRIAVNVKSRLPPSDVEYVIVEHFQHPITGIVDWTFCSRRF